MAPSTVEKIGQFQRTGNMEEILQRSRNVYPEAASETNPSAADAVKGSFADILKQGLDSVNEAQLQSDRAVKEVMAGRDRNIHEAMLLMEKADLTYKLAMQVRNKIIEAYKEVMKMQV